MHFSHRSGVTWGDYLLTESATSSIRSSVNQQTQALVASNERMQASLEQMGRGIADGLAELNASFNWGMSEMLISIGALNDSLEQLIALARNPSQTWSYEQFNIARDAFKRGLFDDALSYVKTAIEGNASQTGYRLDHRFYMLVGLIHLGNHHSQQELIDLDAAEQAFLEAAKYAKSTDVAEAGRAMLSAGWAAFCQKDIGKARKYVTEAIQLNSQLSEAYFLEAKLYMAEDTPGPSLIPLMQAIQLDRDYMLKAQDDPDFLAHSSEVDGLYRQLLESKQERYKELTQALEARMQRIDSFRQSYERIRVDYSEVKDILEDAAKVAAEATYFALDDAVKLVQKANKALDTAIQDAIEGARYLLRQEHAPKRPHGYREKTVDAEALDKGCYSVSLIMLLWGVALYFYAKEELVRSRWPSWHDPISEMLLPWGASIILFGFPLFFIAKAIIKRRIVSKRAKIEADKKAEFEELEAKGVEISKL